MKEKEVDDKELEKEDLMIHVKEREWREKQKQANPDKKFVVKITNIPL